MVKNTVMEAFMRTVFYSRSYRWFLQWAILVMATGLMTACTNAPVARPGMVNYSYTPSAAGQPTVFTPMTLEDY